MSLFIKQDVFDTVLNHLRRQGPATSTTGRCAYRTDTGKSCAVGVLIPDDMYDPVIEKSSPVWELHLVAASHEMRDRRLSEADEALRSLLKRLYPSMTDEDLGLLGRLQVLHDTCARGQWEDFEERMAAFAASLGLVYTKTN